MISNLTLFGACDGYFIFSSALGIFNLRLRGYKALNEMMHRRKVKRSDLIMSLIMIGLLIYSFSCLYGSLIVFAHYFLVPLHIVQLVAIVFTIALAIRFILKTYKMKFQMQNWRMFSKQEHSIVCDIKNRLSFIIQKGGILMNSTENFESFEEIEDIVTAANSWGTIDCCLG